MHISLWKWQGVILNCWIDRDVIISWLIVIGAPLEELAMKNASGLTNDANGVGGILVHTKAHLQDPDPGVWALILIILSKEGLYFVILESAPEPAIDVLSNRVNSCDSDDDTPGFIVVLGDEQ